MNRKNGNEATTDLVAGVGWCYEHNKRSKLGCSEEFQRLKENHICLLRV